ncbi:MAG: hypothetical protein U1E54_03310 [Candidatus Levybacteria bacterium]|nr:hypothetical protein [Candidatus Levybacteria bacterium]
MKIKLSSFISTLTITFALIGTIWGISWTYFNDNAIQDIRINNIAQAQMQQTEKIEGVLKGNEEAMEKVEALTSAVAAANAKLDTLMQVILPIYGVNPFTAQQEIKNKLATTTQ